MKKLMVVLLMCAALGAQTPPATEEMVTVPRKYVSSEGLNQAKSSSAISPYLGMGREIGEAVKGGLESVVDVSNRFADTPVGKFTLFMVAWKVIGRDLLGVVLGLPLYILGICLWVSFMRRMFFERWVTVRNEEGKKVQKLMQPMDFRSGDAKVGTAILMVVILAAWNVGLLNIIF
jgi:hypothetical protein